jgi:hypothetical protein
MTVWAILLTGSGCTGQLHFGVDQDYWYRLSRLGTWQSEDDLPTEVKRAIKIRGKFRKCVEDTVLVVHRPDVGPRAIEVFKLGDRRSGRAVFDPDAPLGC